jgi:hypothetical protein
MPVIETGRARHVGRGALVVAWVLLAAQPVVLGEKGQTACSVESTVPVTIAVVNQMQRPVVMYWIDFECHEVDKGTIEAGGRWDQRTFLTHSWRIRDRETGRVVKEFITTPETSVITYLKDAAPSPETRRKSPGSR